VGAVEDEGADGLGGMHAAVRSTGGGWPPHPAVERRRSSTPAHGAACAASLPGASAGDAATPREPQGSAPRRSDPSSREQGETSMGPDSRAGAQESNPTMYYIRAVQPHRRGGRQPQQRPVVRRAERAEPVARRHRRGPAGGRRGPAGRDRQDQGRCGAAEHQGGRAPEPPQAPRRLGRVDRCGEPRGERRAHPGCGLLPEDREQARTAAPGARAHFAPVAGCAFA
jgi:hypothetical protein